MMEEAQKVKVLYPFSHDNVVMQEGEQLIVIKKTNADWWRVTRLEESASDSAPFYAPTPYLEIVNTRHVKPEIKTRTRLPLSLSSNNTSQQPSLKLGLPESKSDDNLLTKVASSVLSRQRSTSMDAVTFRDQLSSLGTAKLAVEQEKQKKTRLSKDIWDRRKSWAIEPCITTIPPPPEFAKEDWASASGAQRFSYSEPSAECVVSILPRPPPKLLKTLEAHDNLTDTIATESTINPTGSGSQTASSVKTISDKLFPVLPPRPPPRQASRLFLQEVDKTNLISPDKADKAPALPPKGRFNVLTQPEQVPLNQTSPVSPALSPTTPFITPDSSPGSGPTPPRTSHYSKVVPLPRTEKPRLAPRVKHLSESLERLAQQIPKAPMSVTGALVPAAPDLPPKPGKIRYENLPTFPRPPTADLPLEEATNLSFNNPLYTPDREDTDQLTSTHVLPPAALYCNTDFFKESFSASSDDNLGSKDSLDSLVSSSDKSLDILDEEQNKQKFSPGKNAAAVGDAPPSPSPNRAPRRFLPDGWLEYSLASGRPYYYHPTTGSKSWKPPRRNTPLLSTSISNLKDKLGMNDRDGRARAYSADEEGIQPELPLFSSFHYSVKGREPRKPASSSEKVAKEATESRKTQSSKTRTSKYSLPTGWVKSWDVEAEEVCYINSSTGAKRNVVSSPRGEESGESATNKMAFLWQCCSRSASPPLSPSSPTDGEAGNPLKNGEVSPSESTFPSRRRSPLILRSQQTSPLDRISELSEQSSVTFSRETSWDLARLLKKADFGCRRGDGSHTWDFLPSPWTRKTWSWAVLPSELEEHNPPAVRVSWPNQQHSSSPCSLLVGSHKKKWLSKRVFAVPKLVQSSEVASFTPTWKEHQVHVQESEPLWSRVRMAQVEEVEWYSSLDNEGRVYFFEENSNESVWTLPEVPTGEAKMKTDVNTPTFTYPLVEQNLLLLTPPPTDKASVPTITVPEEPSAIAPIITPASTRTLAGSRSERNIKARSMVLTPFSVTTEDVENANIKPSNYTLPMNAVPPIGWAGSLPRGSTMGGQWPSFQAGAINVIHQGVLYKTKITDQGRKVRKNWSSSFVVLTDLLLLLVKDAKAATQVRTGNVANMPELCVDLKGAVLEWACDRSSRKNVFQISTVLGQQLLLQDDDVTKSKEWFEKIRLVIQQLPSSQVTGAGSVPPSPSKPISPTFLTPPTPEEPKRFGRLVRTKSTKVRILGSTEDLTAAMPADRQNKLRDKLKKFFVRRPNLDTLMKKGIYKDEPVFGCRLQNLCAVEQSTVPCFVKQVIAVIEGQPENMKADGLYRASGNLSQVQKIRLQVDQDKWGVLEEEEDVHVLTGALKLFFRELKEPLISHALFAKALQASHLTVKNEKTARFKEIVEMLPKENYETLKFLLGHLLKVTEYREHNRMHISNLAIVFGPTLMWPLAETTNLALDMMQQNLVVEALLTQYADIFKSKS